MRQWAKASDAQHLERLLSRVEPEPNSGCWLWTGAHDGRLGYGHTSVRGRRIGTHRAIYEFLRGPIPQGLHLDHLCRVPACVNPDHLEPVTCRENLFRGQTPSMVRFRANTCYKGHEMTTLPTGRRLCRPCRRASASAYERRQTLKARGIVPAAKTHCLRGHEYTEASTYRRPDTGTRGCRVCRAAQMRSWLAAHPVEAASR